MSPARVLSNAREVALFGDQGDAPNARTGFMRAINVIQPAERHFQYHEHHAEVYLDFGSNSTDFTSTLASMMGEDNLPVGWQYQSDERDAVRSLTLDAFKLFRLLYPDTFTVFTTIIGAFLFGKKEHAFGASVSDIVGAIWMGPNVKWSIAQYTEAIIHEFVHQVLFLEEMVNTIFAEGVPRMSEDDALVTSSILRIPRSYDKSYHSAFVAYVLSEFSQAIGNSAEANTLLVCAEQTIRAC
ncbi:HEXXH motif-containing putative peptide modification protein [Cyanobium sp. FGCU-52]|nr:HEXXH motif-containing putative peptide modification protein [Cyanobium sp. FGCU52]